MVGCMVGTSLAMAPAVLLAQDADFVDLDGPAASGRDREGRVSIYRGRWSHRPSRRSGADRAASTMTPRPASAIPAIT